MSKAAVIFWSQTGNTEQMANAIADGIREGGMEVDVLNVADTTPADAVKYAKIALGCPAMGAEVLEETEFDPFSAPTAGATASGCVTGYSVPTTQTLSSTLMRASSSTKPRTTTASQSARSSARASQHSKLDFLLRRVHTCAQRRNNFSRS